MFKEICTVFSPSGADDKMRSILTERLSPLFDEVYTDTFGNLIAHKSGSGKKICVECGIDTPGIMVVSVSDKKAFFTVFGGLTAAALIGKKIRFANGCFGFVRSDSKTSEDTKVSDLYIEVCGGSVSVSDIGAVDSEYCETDEKIYSHGLAPRAALLAALTAACDLPKSDNDIYFVFTAQKLLGGRGIRAFFAVNDFDEIISVSACGAAGSFKPGCGCGIAVRDKGNVSSPELRRGISDVAGRFAVKHELFAAEDNLYLESFCLAGNSAALCGLCVPIEYKDSAFEGAYKSDIKDTARLICAVL